MNLNDTDYLRVKQAIRRWHWQTRLCYLGMALAFAVPVGIWIWRMSR
jgi:hypothetical protein